MALLGKDIAATVSEAHAIDDEAIAGHAQQLQSAWRELESAAQAIVGTLPSDAKRALANASVFLDAMGHVAIAWMWLKQAALAQQALTHRRLSHDDANFYRGKLAAAAYFFRYELPKTGPQLALVRSLEPLLTALDDAWL
jgi:hypothetical protein